MHRHRNISASKMFFLLIIMIGLFGYFIYDLTCMYYDTYESDSTNFLIENKKETDSESSNVLDVFGYKINIPDFKVFTDR